MRYRAAFVQFEGDQAGVGELSGNMRAEKLTLNPVSAVRGGNGRQPTRQLDVVIRRRNPG
jgi:hypothetical protein